MHRAEELQPSKGDLYHILGLKKEASSEEIRQAYRSAVWTFHPDRPQGKKDAFEEASKAYKILSNKKHRVLYNIFGDEIVPLIQDSRYSFYIDRAMGFKAGTFILCSFFIGYVGILGLPYFSLLSRVGAPYVVIVLPLVIFITLFGITRSIIMPGRRSALFIFFSFLQILSIGLGILCLALHIDRAINKTSLFLFYLLFSVLFLSGYIVKEAESMENISFQSMLYLAIQFFLPRNFSLEMIFSLLFVGSFAVPSTLHTIYWIRGLIPFLYVALYYRKKKISLLILLFLYFVLLFTVGPLILAQKASFMWYDIVGLSCIGVAKLAILSWVFYLLVDSLKRVWRKKAEVFALPGL